MPLAFPLLLAVLTLASSASAQVRAVASPALASAGGDQFERCDPNSDELASRVCASMSLEDRIAQMVMSYPPIIPVGPVNLGAVILVGNLLRSEKAVRNRIDNLQARANIPLLIAVDMEGGKLNRMKFVRDLRAAPSARELGRRGEKEARSWGRRVGRGLAALGINLNLGPVLDLANSGMMFESGRSIGDDATHVARVGRAYALGMREYGVLAIGKHFPGYGDLERNTDFNLVITERPPEEIERQLSAFEKAGDAISGVMLANVGYQSYQGVPAIFSEELVARAHKRGWLTITDDLAIHSLLAAADGSPEEVIRKAFLAGNDILLTTGPVDWDKGIDVRKVVLRLVLSRPELRARVDSSVLRLLRLKERSGLLEGLRRQFPHTNIVAGSAQASTPEPGSL